MTPETYSARLARVIEMANGRFISTALRARNEAGTSVIAIVHDECELFLREIARLDAEHVAEIHSRGPGAAARTAKRRLAVER